MNGSTQRESDAQSPHREAEVRDWLDRFAAAVRARDYPSGLTLFDANVVSFGTVAERVSQLDQLMAGQWRQVWEKTSGFAFGDVVVDVGDDLAWAAATWRSTGHRADGRTFPRAGRATLILRRSPRGWLAVHSHFSFNPASVSVVGRASE